MMVMKQYVRKLYSCGLWLTGAPTLSFPLRSARGSDADFTPRSIQPEAFQHRLVQGRVTRPRLMDAIPNVTICTRVE